MKVDSNNTSHQINFPSIEILTSEEICEMTNYQYGMQAVLAGGQYYGPGLKAEADAISALEKGTPQDQEVANYLKGLPNTPEGYYLLQKAINSGIVPTSH